MTGVGLSNVHYSQEGDDLLVTVHGGSNSDQTDIIRVRDYYNENGGSIEEFIVGATRISRAEIDFHIANLSADENDNNLTKTQLSDRLEGERGSDTYTYTFGGGVGVTIAESGGDADRLVLNGVTREQVQFSSKDSDQEHAGKYGNDLVLSLNQDGQKETVTIENYYQSFGTLVELVEIDGRSYTSEDISHHIKNDAELSVTEHDSPAHQGVIVHTGLTGRFDGKTGDQTYRYFFGKGDLVISDKGGADRLELAGVARQEVQVSRSGDDLIITINRKVPSEASDDEEEVTQSESIRIEDHFGEGGAGRIEEFWIHELTISHDDINSPLSNLSADDTANIVEHSGLSVLLEGKGGDDTYRYRFGWGDITLSDTAGAADVLELIDVTNEQLHWGREGDDLIIVVTQDRQNEIIRVADHYAVSGTGRIETFVVDGNRYARSEVEKQVLNYAVSDGTDVVELVTLAAHAEGGAGNDTYQHTFGKGDFTIFDEAGADTIELLDTTLDDVTFARDTYDLLIRINKTDDDGVEQRKRFG